MGVGVGVGVGVCVGGGVRGAVGAGRALFAAAFSTGLPQPAYASFPSAEPHASALKITATEIEMLTPLFMLTFASGSSCLIPV